MGGGRILTQERGLAHLGGRIGVLELCKGTAYIGIGVSSHADEVLDGRYVTYREVSADFCQSCNFG